jgi:hypothetical protein
MKYALRVGANFENLYLLGESVTEKNNNFLWAGGLRTQPLPCLKQGEIRAGILTD